jgi:hypothetical protein
MRLSEYTQIIGQIRCFYPENVPADWGEILLQRLRMFSGGEMPTGHGRLQQKPKLEITRGTCLAYAYEIGNHGDRKASNAVCLQPEGANTNVWCFLAFRITIGKRVEPPVEPLNGREIGRLLAVLNGDR